MKNIFLLILMILLLFFSGDFISLYVDSLWYSEIHFEQVFTKMILTEFQLGSGLGIVFFFLIYFNLLWIIRFKSSRSWGIWQQQLHLPFLNQLKNYFHHAILLVSIVSAFFAAIQGAGEWRSFLLFLNPT
ncbi:MAG: UPF0182 family protein, partial [Nitrospiria bacterium]